MTSQSQRPTPVCLRRMRTVWLSVGAALLLATPALCDTVRVNTYDSWRWNGFSWSPPPVEATLKSTSSTSTVWRFSNLTSSTTTTTSTQTTTSSISSTTNILASLTYSALQDTDVASISKDGRLAGYVYVDTNKNGVMDMTDWAIAEAKIQLTGNGMTTLAYSNKDGSYSFSSLTAGVYSLTMLTECVAPGTDTKGQILDKAGKVDTARTNAVDASVHDVFSNIQLPAAYTGVNFNFAELVYPISLVSKRMLIGDDPGVIHTVPEPGAFALLAIAGACFGGLAWRRRR